MECIYCGKQLTEAEIKNLADAEDLTVAETLARYSTRTALEDADIMCDSCATADVE